MTTGLRVWSASGKLTFDSTLATGGACLGIFTIPAGGTTLTFPDFVGYTGIAICTGTGGALNGYTTDNGLGYLRFVFMTAGNVVLFAK